MLYKNLIYIPLYAIPPLSAKSGDKGAMAHLMLHQKHRLRGIASAKLSNYHNNRNLIVNYKLILCLRVVHL